MMGVVENVVERGDTVVRIARRYGTFSSNVVTATGELPDTYRLKHGQTLYVRPIGTQSLRLTLSFLESQWQGSQHSTEFRH